MFQIDTHIHRLAHRWGLSDGTTVERTERSPSSVSEDTWNRRHLQIIFFGREYCPAQSRPGDLRHLLVGGNQEPVTGGEGSTEETLRHQDVHLSGLNVDSIRLASCKSVVAPRRTFRRVSPRFSRPCDTSTPTSSGSRKSSRSPTSLRGFVTNSASMSLRPPTVLTINTRS